MKLSGVAFVTLNDCKQGLPWIQELWMSKLFHLCLHTCTSSLYFCPCLARKFMVFFQMQRQPCTEQQNSHIWSCVQSYAPYLTLTFLHCVLEQRNEAHLHGQGRELLRQAVPPWGNDSMTALLTAAPGCITSCWLWWAPQLHPGLF